MQKFPPNRHLLFGILLGLILGQALPASAAEEIILDDYQNGLSSWKQKSFSGHTHYTVDKSDNQTSVLAQSKGAASGIFYEIEFDPKKHPILRWSWKVDNIIDKGDARIKSGDDYPARIYVVFPSFLFWRTTALNYIWANKLPKGTQITNAYTENAVMIAVESGSENLGRWLSCERNIYEDYKKAFGKEPPKVGAIAIMTDTDNTGESATARYGIISLTSTPKN